MGSYEVRRYSPEGLLLDVVRSADDTTRYVKQFSKLTYVRTENTVGAMELIVPLGNYQYVHFSTNQILEIWSESKNRLSLLNETAYFLRNWEFISTEEGKFVRLLCYDANWLIKSRIIAYVSGSIHSTMTDYADDMIKEIGRDNFEADAPNDRKIPRVSVASDRHASSTVTKEFAWQNMLDTFQEICAAATTAGTPTYFDMVRDYFYHFQLRTYTGQRGVNHGRTSSDLRLVSEEAGTLSDAVLGTYHSDELNYIYAGGDGRGSSRIVVDASNDAQIAIGYPFNRCEGFIYVSSEWSNAILAEARRELKERSYKQTLTGKVVETPEMQYGVHFGFGDIITAEAFGFQVDCHVSSVREVVDKTGSKRDIRLSGEL